MDRNQVIGLVLISLLLIFYFQYFTPIPAETTPAVPPQEETQLPATDGVVSQQEIIAQESRLPDSIKNSVLNAQFGFLSEFGEGEAKEIILENNDVKIWFSSHGGRIVKVQLKEYLTHSKQPLVLLDNESSQMALSVGFEGKNLNLYDLYYSSDLERSSDTTTLNFMVKLSDSRWIQQSYSMANQGFQVKYNIRQSGFDNLIDPVNGVFTWNNRMKLLEKDIKESRNKTTITYYTSAGDFDDLGERSMDLEEEQITEPVKWAAFKQQFFTAGFITHGAFTKSLVRTSVNVSDPQIEKEGYMALEIPIEDIKNNQNNFTFYFGPNNYQYLKKVTEGFSENIYLGWPPINLVNKWLIIPLFNFFDKYIESYGLIIIILVLVIKILLSPLSYKSYVSMAKTKVLKPELDAIKEKHGGDMQKAQKEQMKLYQQVGVNPLSGCIPLVLQMPILFAMFYFFPNSIELRQEAFLWADDLSTYDSILDLPFTIPMYGDHVSLFTILMTASTILYTWSNNQMTTIQGPMKTFTYLMPLIFMVVLNSFPASLSFYYFIANVVTFGQQAIIRKFVDEEKIKTILDENRLKNKSKKKSKFQMKLEEAMRAGEARKNKKR